MEQGNGKSWRFFLQFLVLGMCIMLCAIAKEELMVVVYFYFFVAVTLFVDETDRVDEGRKMRDKRRVHSKGGRCAVTSNSFTKDVAKFPF